MALSSNSGPVTPACCTEVASLEFAIGGDPRTRNGAHATAGGGTLPRAARAAKPEESAHGERSGRGRSKLPPGARSVALLQSEEPCGRTRHERPGSAEHVRAELLDAVHGLAGGAVGR